MGRQMLSNLRDGLENETYVKLLENKAIATPEFIEVTKADLVGHYDFEVFDGTLPSERMYTAQALEELLAGLLKNPQAAVMLGIDPKKLLMESLTLRNVRNPERFQLDLGAYGQPTVGAPTAVGPGGPVEGIQPAIPESVLPLPTLGALPGGVGVDGQSVSR